MAITDREGREIVAILKDLQSRVKRIERSVVPEMNGDEPITSTRKRERQYPGRSLGFGE